MKVSYKLDDRNIVREVRRLAPRFESQGWKKSFATTWLWYWKDDDGTYVEYGKQVMLCFYLEKLFCGKKVLSELHARGKKWKEIINKTCWFGYGHNRHMKAVKPTCFNPPQYFWWYVLYRVEKVLKLLSIAPCSKKLTEISKVAIMKGKFSLEQEDRPTKSVFIRWNRKTSTLLLERRGKSGDDPFLHLRQM